jgi:hypothetical protein
MFYEGDNKMLQLISVKILFSYSAKRAVLKISYNL